MSRSSLHRRRNGTLRPVLRWPEEPRFSCNMGLFNPHSNYVLAYRPFPVLQGLTVSLDNE